MARGTAQQPFTRLPVPSSHSALQPVVSDIYDQLSAIPQSLQAKLQTQLDAFQKQLQAQTSATTTTPGTVTPNSVAGGGSSSSTTTTGPTIYLGTHAVRDVSFPASAGPYGSVYCENDRQAVYYTDTLNWVLIFGIGFGVRASRYADLGVFDAGYLWITPDEIQYRWTGTTWVYVSGIEYMTLATFGGRVWTIDDNKAQVGILDYQHEIYLDFPNWKFATSDPGSNFMVPSGDGTTPFGGIWQPCDGTTVTVFKIVAGVPTTVNITTRDMRSDVFIRGVSVGAYTGAIDAGTAPVFHAAGLTFAGTPAVLTGTNTAPAFTGSAMGTHTHEAPVGSVSSTTAFLTSAFGTGTARARSVDFTTIGSAASAAVFLTGATSAGTPAGSVAAPVLTMASYTPAGTIAGTGTIDILTVGAGAPKSIGVVWYLRR